MSRAEMLAAKARLETCRNCKRWKRWAENGARGVWLADVLTSGV